MNDIVAEQIQFMLAAMCFGMLTICMYDAFRLLRWIFPHGKRLVAVEDILYWMVMSVCCYIVFLEYNDGKVRWYGLACVIFGAILYETGISRGIRKKGDEVFSPMRKKIRMWLWRKRQKRKVKKAQNNVVKSA